MVPTSSEQPQITRLLKNALVADFVFGDAQDLDERWLTEPNNDEHGWTGHLGRQIGIPYTYRGDAHYTLLLIVRELDDLLRRWPPPTDNATYQLLANAATKSLTPIQLYETLLAGPKRWRQGGKLAGGTTVESLPAQLQAILERMLTSELVQMMERWVAWDVRKLREKRNELIEAEKATEAERRAAIAVASAVAKPPRRRITAKDRDDNPRPNYRPPPRT